LGISPLAYHAVTWQCPFKFEVSIGNFYTVQNVAPIISEGQTKKTPNNKHINFKLKCSWSMIQNHVQVIFLKQNAGKTILSQKYI
jgi:hypothetical protein